MARIFISYRRSDSRKWANKLFEHISMRFGKDLVFQDVDDIKPGKDFLLVLHEAITDLQLLRGYFHKNEAMALRDLGRRAEFRKSLVKADRVFTTMIRERPDDAGAWNGKGSVEALRGNLEKALRYVDKALEIDPTYWAAQQDRKEILKYLGAKA